MGDPASWRQKSKLGDSALPSQWRKQSRRLGATGELLLTSDGLHVPGWARWLTPEEELMQVCTIHYFYIFLLLFVLLYVFSFWFWFSGVCFFLEYTAFFGRRDRLPFLAGEVDCLFFDWRGRLPFWQAFFSAWWWYCACVRVAVVELLWSVTVLPKDETEHTGYTFTPWVFYSPWHRAPGRRDLNLTSLP